MRIGLGKTRRRWCTRTYDLASWSKRWAERGRSFGRSRVGMNGPSNEWVGEKILSPCKHGEGIFRQHDDGVKPIGGGLLVGWQSTAEARPEEPVPLSDQAA